MKGLKSAHYIIAVMAGLMVVLFLTWFQITSNNSVSNIRDRLEYLVYDLRLKTFAQDKPQINAQAIFIDIDDKSLEKYGRWPWSRETLIALVNKLQEQGVVLIVFDIVFSEPERNIIDNIIKKDPAILQQISTNELTTLKQKFDVDYKFSLALKNGEFVMALILDNLDRKNSGYLPKPYLDIPLDTLNALSIYPLKSYTSNIAILQKQAPESGFISVIPDSDGLIRKVPLLLRYEDKVYASLALQAVSQYLLVQQPSLVVTQRGDSLVLSGIKLADITIPVDQQARMLIPFQGKQRTIPTYSVADVMDNHISKDQLENKLVFIGTSALGLGDLKATPVAAVFPGTEIQATIANAILEKHFITSPEWVKSLYFILFILLGIILSLILPVIATTKNLIISTSLIIAIIFIDFKLWQYYLIAVPLFSSVLMVFILSIANSVFSYFSERKNKLYILNMFEQYVPPGHIQDLVKQSDTLQLGGEAREMTVLFSDIVGFTSICEGISPEKITAMLNYYLSNMSKEIFKYDGTIDKYVGDMIMAFWNAPLKDQNHTRHAMQAAISMQQTLFALKEGFEKQGLPHFKIGIGVNTGNMLVGDMGSTFRRNYTVLGDAVNLASRLESLTRYYGVEIIVSEACIKKVPELLCCKLDTITVKGKVKPVIIYELIVPPADEATLEKIKNEVSLFESILAFYSQQNWEAAEKGINELIQLNPNKKLYQIYYERLQTLKSKPFDPNWNGVFTFVTK